MKTKKSIRCLLSTAMAMLFLVLSMFGNVSAAPNATPVFGDVNGDDLVNTGDVAMLLRYCLNDNIGATVSEDIADINGDSLINTGDASALLMKILSAEHTERAFVGGINQNGSSHLSDACLSLWYDEDKLFTTYEAYREFYKQCAALEDISVGQSWYFGENDNAIYGVAETPQSFVSFEEFSMVYTPEFFDNHVLAISKIYVDAVLSRDVYVKSCHSSDGVLNIDLVNRKSYKPDSEGTTFVSSTYLVFAEYKIEDGAAVPTSVKCNIEYDMVPFTDDMFDVSFSADIFSGIDDYFPGVVLQSTYVGLTSPVFVNGGMLFDIAPDYARLITAGGESIQISEYAAKYDSDYFRNNALFLMFVEVDDINAEYSITDFKVGARKVAVEFEKKAASDDATPGYIVAFVTAPASTWAYASGFEYSVVTPNV